MVNLKNGEVKVGDKVLLNQGKDKPALLGIFESLYDNKMNVRAVSTNELHTSKFEDVIKADDKTVDKYYLDKSKNQLLAEVARINEELKKHGIEAVVSQLKPAGVAQLVKDGDVVNPPPTGPKAS